MNIEQKELLNNFNFYLKLVKYPLFTNKSLKLLHKNRYSFLVDRKLKKPHIKLIFEKIFNIKIKKINTLILPTQSRKFSQVKKSYTKKIILTVDKLYKIENIF